MECKVLKCAPLKRSTRVLMEPKWNVKVLGVTYSITSDGINGTKVECKVLNVKHTKSKKKVLMEPKWNVKEESWTGSRQSSSY